LASTVLRLQTALVSLLRAGGCNATRKEKKPTGLVICAWERHHLFNP
jgi:hypothetical protein